MIAIIAVVGLALALAFIYLLTRRTDVAVICAVMENLLLLTTGGSQTVIGGLHFSLSDGINICLLVAGVIRLMQHSKFLTFPRLLALIYLSLFAFSLVRGVAQYGIATASNESRGMLGQLLVFLYFIDVDVDEQSVRRYVQIYIGFGAALCVIAVLALAGLPVGTIAISWAGPDVDFRVVPAGSASVFAISAVLALGLLQYRKRGLLIQAMPVLFLVFAVYMRHRTVWIMLLLAFTVMGFFDRKLFLRVLIPSLIAIAAVGGIVFYGNTHQDVADESAFADSASNTGTWEWRVNSWLDLFFDKEQTPLTVVIGKSMGSGYWRIDPDTHEADTAPPHNEFLQNYLRVGVIGAICILLLSVRPIFILRQSGRLDQLAVYPSASVWILIAFMLLSFGLTYSLDVHQYALIGIANAIASKLQRPRQELSANDNLVERDYPAVLSRAE